MKTAVSIPDELFEQAESRAHELGLSRSGFYARAIAHELAAAEREDVMARLAAVYDDVEAAGDDASIGVVARRRLGESAW